MEEEFLSGKIISNESINLLIDVLIRNRSDEEIQILFQKFDDCLNAIIKSCLNANRLINGDEETLQADIAYTFALEEIAKSTYSNKEKLQHLFKEVPYFISIAIDCLIPNEFTELYNQIHESDLQSAKTSEPCQPRTQHDDI